MLLVVLGRVTVLVYVRLGVHAHLVLTDEVQQIVMPPVAHKIVCRDAGWVVRQGQVVDLVDAQLVKVPRCVFVHGNGVERLLCQRWGRHAQYQDKGKKQAQNPFSHAVGSSFRSFGMIAARFWAAKKRPFSRCGGDHG